MRPSLEPVGSEAISRQIMSALSYNVGHPAGVGRSSDMSKTYTSSVRSSEWQQGEKKEERVCSFNSLTLHRKVRYHQAGLLHSSSRRNGPSLILSQSGDSCGGEC